MLTEKAAGGCRGQKKTGANALANAAADALAKTGADAVANA